MNKGDLITTIQNINFYYGGLSQQGWTLIYTDDENFHTPEGSDHVKECNRIYNNYYI